MRSKAAVSRHARRPAPMLRLPVRAAQGAILPRHSSTLRRAPLAPQAGAHQARSRVTAGLPVSDMSTSSSATAAPVTAAAAAAAAAAPPAQSVAAVQGVQGSGANAGVLSSGAASSAAPPALPAPQHNIGATPSMPGSSGDSMSSATAPVLAPPSSTVPATAAPVEPPAAAATSAAGVMHAGASNAGQAPCSKPATVHLARIRCSRVVALGQ